MAHESQPLSTPPASPGLTSEHDRLGRSVVLPRLLNPTKVWILEAMSWIGRPLAPSDLAMIADSCASSAAIAYHLATLVQLGMVEPVEHQVRNGVETRCRVVDPR